MPLRAARYLPLCREPDDYAGLLEELHSFTFAEACGLYAKLVPRLAPPEIALLGANDRFFLLTELLGRTDALHPWIYARCREVECEPDGYLDLWARFHYKDLDVRTPVLTTKGWKEHGQLEAGDQVFSPSGEPVRVLGVQHFTDSACYRVTLDNDASFVCGAGHRWTVDIPSRARVKGTKNGRVPHKTVTLTTEELAGLQTLYRPFIPVTKALHLPKRDLPIDPYVFGAWLGDGSKASGRTSGDHWLFLNIEARGYRVGQPSPSELITRTVYGIQPLLRALGVLNQKSIPECYMMASADQRLALLQGLIDTDGHVSRINRCITFAQKNYRLAEQVRVLANSLGFKARITPVRANGGSWHVVFQASLSERPCVMPRKLERLDDTPGRLSYRGWRIHSIERVDTVPTNCIRVDAADGLYLVGRELIATHNTSIGTFAGNIQEIIDNPEVTIAIFSATTRLAQEFLSQIKEELERNERLKDLYPDVFWREPRKQAPIWSVARGIVVKRQANPKEPTIGGYGLIDGMPTGFHFDILDYDDLVTVELATNVDMVKKATERYELSHNLGKAEGTRRRMKGTRYSFADSYGQLIERGIVKVRLYPATENGKLDGKPVLMTDENWAETKKAQRSTVAAQMLQNPLAGSEATFDPHSLKSFLLRPRTINVYIMGDPSQGLKAKTSDRTAIVAIAVDHNKNKFLIDGYCHRMKLSERWENLRNLYKRWRNAVGVQSCQVGWERYGMQSDLQYFEERMQMKDEIGFPIEELNWTREGDQSKKSRVQRLEPDFNRNAFYLPAKVWSPHVTWINADGVSQSGPRTCLWNVDSDSGKIEYRPIKLGTAGIPMETREERQAREAGEIYRIIQPIRRRDEDGNAYDLTRMFFDEYLFFPFTPHDDLIDAVSRIFDMTPEAPMIVDKEFFQTPEYQD